MRRFVRDVLKDQPPEILDAAELMACELATNCVRHAHTDFELAIHSQAQIRVEVRDTDQGRPTLRSPTPEEPSGRGLLIVEAMSDTWGIIPSSTGKTVWFALQAGESDEAPTRAASGERERDGGDHADLRRGRGGDTHASERGQKNTEGGSSRYSGVSRFWAKMGVWRTVDAALPQIVARRGHVVVISSVYAFLNGAGAAPYAMSKAAVEQFGRALRLELAPHGASASVAYFGFIDTEMVHRAIDADELANEMLSNFPKPLHKRLSPSAGAVHVFVHKCWCSPEASVSLHRGADAWANARAQTVPGLARWGRRIG